MDVKTIKTVMSYPNVAKIGVGDTAEGKIALGCDMGRFEGCLILIANDLQLDYEKGMAENDVVISEVNRCGSDSDLQSSTDKAASRAQLNPAPRTFSEWLCYLESCPQAIASLAKTPQEAYRIQSLLDQWRLSGRPEITP